MLDIVTWLWHDPLLEGSRGSRRYVPVAGASIRPDLMLNARRRKKLIARGKALPNEPSLPTQVAYGPPQAARSFKSEHVNRLAELVAHFLPIPHRFVCIADETEGFSDKVTVVKTPEKALEMSRLRSPEGNRFPSCYRRLWSQSHEASKILSERVLLIDIDLLPVADWRPLVTRDEPFVGWRPYRDWGRRLRIGGGFYLFTPGAHPEVWDDFVKNPSHAIAGARNAGFRGSDQAWLSYKLADKVPIYPRTSGIYSIRDLGHDHALPKDARLVQFNGPQKPWSYGGRAQWVAAFWKGR